MDEWVLFLERGKKDLELSQKLFQENQDYEMSAYVAQQALEKYVKAYLLKSNIVEKARDLGHFQMPRIFSLIAAQFNLIKRNTDKSNPFHLVLEHMSNVIDHLKKLFETIRDDNKKLVHWWKYSLKITQDIEDEDYKKFIELMSRTGSRLGKSFETYFGSSLNPNIEKFAKISKELPADILTISENMEKAATQLKNKKILSKEEARRVSNEEISVLLKIINLQKRGKPKGSLSISELEKALIMFDILTNYLDLIMQTYPHEIIGRYPRLLDVSTTETYTKHKENLWEMSSNVKNSCNEIEMKIKNN